VIAKNIKNEIKEHFFINPSQKLRVRQIERLLSLPLPSVIRYCKELETEKILERVQIGNVVFYTGNRNSDAFLLEKKLFNIKQAYSSGLISYLKRELSNPGIILFGSYAKGEDREESDIDLYIETPSKKTLNLEKFERILSRKIEVFRFKAISDIKNKHLANNILNGITLSGFARVFE